MTAHPVAPVEVPPPQPGTPGGYFPELRDAPPVRLFGAESLTATCYCLCWRVEHDEAARTHLKRLRIRPSEVKRYAPEDWLPARGLDFEVFGCHVTVRAHAKLEDAGTVATRLRLRPKFARMLYRRLGITVDDIGNPLRQNRQ